MSKVNELRAERARLVNRAHAIMEMARSEGRDMTPEDDVETDSILAQITAKDGEIEKAEANEARRLKIDAMAKDLSTPMGRLTEPVQPNNTAAGIGVGSVGDGRQGNLAVGRITIADEPGKLGYKSLGEFANDVRGACKGGRISDKLANVMNAPTTFVSEGVGQDGGYLVPPDFKTEIWEKVSGEESLIQMTQRETTTGNTIVLPADETTPWGNSGGVRAFYESEAEQLQQSKIALQSRTISLNKLTALVPVTSEMLEDVPSVDSYLRRRTPEVMDFVISQKMLSGSGVGEPLGLLNAPSLITVNKDASQPSSTVTATNIMNMWTRMYARWRRRSIWLINQDIEAQLMQMYLAIKNAAGTDNVGGWPLYVPVSTGLSGGPYSTLMGRPVIETQACSALGSPGDIILTDLKQYMSVVKSGTIKVDVSMHLWFDYDMQCFRFILRHTGQPLWKTTITPANDAVNTLSWAVVLQQR